jgi:ElaA protein
VRFRCLTWSELSTDDLYAAMALRQRVFVVEQNCPYLDADGLDPRALHLLGERDGALIAFARLFAPGVHGSHAVIGRVVTAPEVRREGLGRALMAEAIGQCEARGWTEVKISAQAYLERFYGSLGFEVCGEGYLEDGIPHLPMVRYA